MSMWPGSGQCGPRRESSFGGGEGGGGAGRGGGTSLGLGLILEIRSPAAAAAASAASRAADVMWAAPGPWRDTGTGQVAVTSTGTASVVECCMIVR